MLRLLILASMYAIINASIIPNYMLEYPRSLQSLFSAKREATEVEDSEREVCRTKECNSIAKIIKESMDESVNPCDDFYEYACGNWSNAVPIPENASIWSLWDIAEKRLEAQIKGLIQKKEKPDDLFAVKLAKKWYHSCMDEERIEKRGVEPLVNTLWRHGGWPLIMEDGEWDENIYRWQIVDDQYARLIGMSTFYEIIYGKMTWEGNATIVIVRPHLPSGVRRLISFKEFMELQSEMDSSDENNESGEGSQEKGSREKADENEDKQEDEDENEEDNEIDDGWVPAEESEGKLRKKKVATGHRRRLGHGSRRQKKVANNNNELKRKRIKRNDMNQKLLHRLLHQLNKANKHKAHAHMVHNKLGHKRVEKQSDKSLNSEKNSNKRENIDETEEEEERSRKKKVMKKKGTKRLGHGKRKSEAVGKKSKTYGMKRRIEGNRKHQKIDNHRVHRARNRMSDTESNDDDENEASDGDLNDDEEENNATDETNDEDNEEKEEDEETDDEDNDDEDDGSEEDDLDPEADAERAKEAREQYRDYILNVALILSKGRGIEVTREQMLKDIDDMIDFIIKLTHLMIASEGENELLNMTLNGLQEHYDSIGPVTPTNKINWVRKVEKLFSEVNVEVDSNAEVLLTSAKYFEKLHELLGNTPQKVIVNYVHWLFIDSTQLAMVKQLADLHTKWSGRHGPYNTREELCLTLVQLTNIAGYQYIQEYFDEDIAKSARDMIDDIQKEVEHQIEESKWMSEDTRHFVLDKVVYMKNWIGYPEWYRNTTIVKRYFQGLTIGPSFYENVINYIRYRSWKKLRQILRYMSDDKINDELNPLELNAFFMPDENSIGITAADLQSPFFSHNRPWYVNFGIVGVVMGHEVNHGFDDLGHLFDKDGNRVEWLSAMADAYNKRAKCVVDQYNKYTIIKGTNFKVENYGNQTIGDNIADIMGLHTVFRAYKRRERECGKEDPALPGFEQFSNNQMFFLSFANSWCEKRTEESLKIQALRDGHSTAPLRVIGSVSNSEEFAKAFKCPVGSPMNPANKCNIWE